MPDATNEQMKAWVRRWEDTGEWLATVRVHEVASLTELQAMLQTRALLNLEAGWRAQPGVSGLEEQQALFQKLRPR